MNLDTALMLASLLPFSAAVLAVLWRFGVHETRAEAAEQERGRDW